MEFRTPLFLWIIPLVVGGLVWAFFHRRPGAFLFPADVLLEGIRPTLKVRLRHAPFFLRLVVLTLVLFALAGPRSPLEGGRVHVEGVDIVLLVDSSTSMAAEDFTLKGQRANRLEAVKRVVAEFVEKRKDDRLGLIAFAGRPYTVCPLTVDHAWLLTNLERLQFGLMEDGTAIGSAIAAGVNRLRDSKAKSRVLVLLTDGMNNAGSVHPHQAMEIARTLGVRIYTIGAGTRGMAPYPVQDIFGRSGYQNIPTEIDEKILEEIAEGTGGQYFRATDTASLQEIYDKIDLLEKTEYEDVTYREYRELFSVFLIAALGVLLIEVLLARTVFLSVP